MVNPWITRITRLFGPLLRRWEVDARQLALLLQVRFHLVNRKAPAFGGAGVQKQDHSYLFLIRGLLYLIFGGVFGLIFMLSVSDQYTAQALVHGAVILFLFLNLIMDFSTVLADTGEWQTLGARPVAPRTFLLSRILFISAYLLFIGLALMLPSLIFIAVTIGPVASLWMLLTLIPDILLSLFFTHLVYLGLFRLTSGERLKDLLVFVQIGLTVGIYLAVQVANDLIGEFALTPKWSHLLVPVYYPGGFLEVMVAGHNSTIFLIQSVLLFVLPAAGMVAVVTWLGPTFTRGLSRLEETEAAQSGQQAGKLGLSRWGRWLSRVLCPHPQTRAAFHVTWLLCARDRVFKQQTYPNFGMYLVIAILPLIRNPDFSPEKMAEVQASGLYLLGLYLPALVIFSFLMMIAYGSQSGTEWWWQVRPQQQYGRWLEGVYLAVLGRFALPVMLILVPGILVIGGWRAIDDVVLGFAVLWLIATLFFRFNPTLPMVDQYNQDQGIGNLGKFLATFAAIGVLGAIHFFLHKFQPALILALGPVLLGLAYWQQRLIRHGFARFPGNSS